MVIYCNLIWFNAIALACACILFLRLCSDIWTVFHIDSFRIVSLVEHFTSFIMPLWCTNQSCANRKLKDLLSYVRTYVQCSVRLSCGLLFKWKCHHTIKNNNQVNDIGTFNYQSLVDGWFVWVLSIWCGFQYIFHLLFVIASMVLNLM